MKPSKGRHYIMFYTLQKTFKALFYNCLDTLSGAKRAKPVASPFTLLKQRHNQRANKVLVAGYQLVEEYDDPVNNVWSYELVLPYFINGSWLLAAELTGRPCFFASVVDLGFPLSESDLLAKVVGLSHDGNVREGTIERIREQQAFLNNVKVGAPISMNNDGSLYINAKNYQEFVVKDANHARH